MTGKTKAKSRTQQPEKVFIDSNGRTSPISSPRHTCLNKSTTSTEALVATAHIDKAVHSKQRHTESTFSKQISDIRTTPMSAVTAIYVGPEEDPQVESSKSGAARHQVQAPDSDSSRPIALVDSESSSESSLDTLTRDSSTTSPERGISLLLSPPAAPAHPWPNTDTASMHSDQEFDLEYKAKPAPPFCYKLYARSWNSSYTRPMEDICRDILEVWYPYVEKPKVSLLRERGWYPRSLFMRFRDLEAHHDE